MAIPAPCGPNIEDCLDALFRALNDFGADQRYAVGGNLRGGYHRLCAGEERRPAEYAKALLEDISKGKLYLIDAPQDDVADARASAWPS
jgi:hypothetical protein